jgi:hypothetical protein
MPRPMTHPPVLVLPCEPDLDRLPRYATKDQLAEIHCRYFGPISKRTIRESWPLEWHLLNDRQVSETRAFLAEAQRRFDAAPVVRGGCQAAPQTEAAVA